MSFPHNLVLDSQPRFGFIQSEFLNPCHFPINWRIFIKFAGKCKSLQPLSFEFVDNLFVPIPLIQPIAPIY